MPLQLIRVFDLKKELPLFANLKLDKLIADGILKAGSYGRTMVSFTQDRLINIFLTVPLYPTLLSAIHLKRVKMKKTILCLILHHSLITSSYATCLEITAAQNLFKIPPKEQSESMHIDGQDVTIANSLAGRYSALDGPNRGAP